MPNPLKLFISYRSSDAPQVDQIALDLSLLRDDLGGQRYIPWQDKRNLPPASPYWWDAIVDAIEACDVFLFHISRESLRSTVCQAELSYAHALNRPIIPIVLEGEFFLNPVSGKYDLLKEGWSLVPDWLGERQFLFYTGANFFQRFEQAMDMFRRNWPRPLSPKRPLNPDTNDLTSNHARYAQACDYAERLAFTEAEKLFDALVRRNDPDYGAVAVEWLELLRLYTELIEIDFHPRARFRFKLVWEKYTALFPKDFWEGVFDPKGFTTKLSSSLPPLQQPSIRSLLLDYAYLENKLNVSDVDGLLAEFKAPEVQNDTTLRLMESAIRLSSHVLSRDKTALCQQLVGRLMGYRSRNTTLQRLITEWTAQESISPMYLDSPYVTHIPAGEPVVQILTGHSHRVMAVAFTPDGSRAVSASTDKTLILWDLNTGQAIRTLTGHSQEIRAVALTPDGSRAVSASRDKTLILWDLNTGQAIRTLTGHSQEIRAVAITPDGSRAVSASWDNTLILWDLATGEAIRTLTGHSDEVNAVAITPDGSRAVSASQDKTLKVWNVVSGACLASYYGDAAFYSCSWSRDRQVIVAGDIAGRVHFLRYDESKLHS